MAVQDYKINYKSDFVLTINGDAGWATQFCIKFWTGMPSQAYFVGFDGVKYVNCRVGDTPTQLLVMFDDHHLPIGKLMMQIAYHTTIEEFPGSVFDEVTNARDVIVTIDGTDYQVMLDFTGEDAPELEFDLPAYANEAERIQNELQRQQNEADRIAAELQREQATAAAVAGAENVNAQLNGTTLTVTNRNGVSTSVNTKGEQGEQGPVGPEGPQGEQGETGISIVSFTPKSETSTALIYTVTFSDGHTQDVPIPKGAKGDTGATGPQGPQGDTGVSITGFVETGETETATLYNITFSNGTTQAVAIPKGEKGDQGPAGPQGPQGPMGDVAVITPEQQAAFTMYSEPGQNTNGPMTQKAVTDALGNVAASGVSYDNSDSGMAAVNVQNAIDEVSNEIFGKELGKYNSDNIATNYTVGLLKSTNGSIDSSRTSWRTSDFLELPSTSTTISVHGVFPYKSSLKNVGCYLYDENKTPIGYPSNIPTASAAASFTFSTGSYPTAKYVRISEFTSGYSGDDCYITPVYVKGDRLGGIESDVSENTQDINNLSQDLSENIPFCFQTEYISTSGVVTRKAGATNAYATDYIKVKSGDILHFNNIGWNSNALNHCWGYDEYKNPVIRLLGGYTLTVPFSGDVTVPNNVVYIKAFGNITITPSLTISRASNIYEKLEKYDFNIVGSYIKNTGEIVYNSSSSPIRTEMIKVTEGDVLIGKDLFWGGESTLSQCWGYDSNGSPVQELVPCYPESNPFNGKITIPQGVSYISAFSRSTGNPELYRDGSIYKYIDGVACDPKATINYVTVVQDGVNYNLIRTLLASITDASSDNRYVVIIPNGSYFECDLKGKKYVTLHGESKENTIIYCDGTSSNVTPSNYTYASDSNKALSSVIQDHKHIFHLSADLNIENCTLQSNDVKYCIHFEDSAWAKAVIKDCIFIATDNHSAVGFGLRWKQQAEFIRCEFRVTGCTNAVYTHNWDWQKTTDEHIPISGGGVLVKFDGCKFTNQGQYLLTIGEIGSFNDDKVAFVCCKTDNPSIRALVETTGNRTYHIKKDGTYETNPLLVPYCMHLDMINCGVDGSITFSLNNRPDFENYCMIIN